MNDLPLFSKIRAYNAFVLVAGWILFLAGVVSALIWEATYWWNLTLVGLGLLALLGFLAANLSQVKEISKKRTTIVRANLTLMAISMLGIIAAINYIASRHPARFDLTSNKIYSLSEQTVSVLEGLKQDVTVTFMTSPAHNGAIQASIKKAQELLTEYSKYSTKFHVKIVDVDRNPGPARQLGVRENNTVVFEYGEKRRDILQREYVTYAMQGRQPTAKFNGESAFTSALLTMLDATHLTIYFTEGHGERELNNPQADGYTSFKTMLEQENYTVKTLNLLKENKIPEDAAVVAILGPSKAFQPSEAALLSNYLKKGGKVMLCADLLDALTHRPIVSNGLSSLLKDFGVRLRNDIAVDETRYYLNPMAVLPQYVYHPIVEKLIQAKVDSLMVFSRAVEKIEPGLQGATPAVFLQTTDKGWGLTDHKQKPVFRPGRDVKGPIPMAVASEWLLPDGSGKKARLAVYGTSLFPTNQFAAGGNIDLAVNTFAWLADQESKISLHPKDDDMRFLTLNNVNANVVLFLAIVVVPLTSLLAGILVWYRRRSI